MEVDRFNRIEELYHQALQLAPDLREEFLEQACGDDAELCREIETLLEFEDSPPDIFDLPPESLAAKMVAELPARNDLVNRNLSQYKVLRLIGEGGMGEV